MGRILDDSEVGFFDSIASELNELVGVHINYWTYNSRSDENKSKVDPLYGEISEPRSIDGPHRVWAYVKYPEHQPSSSDTGFAREWDASVSIARLHLDEKNLPYPTEDDIIELWRTPYHDAMSMHIGLFFDVIKIKHDGHVHDTPTFTMFELTLKRRTQFGAERRLQEG